MKRTDFFLVLGLLMMLPGPMPADDGDDTLRFFMAKSDVVVLGEFVSVSGPNRREFGVNHYRAEFKIAQLIKGKVLGKRRSGDTIQIGIVRFEVGVDDRCPELKKGGQAILFLSTIQQDGGARETYLTTDIWFGIQRPSRTMARSLSRLSNN